MTSAAVTDRCCGADCVYEYDQAKYGQCWGRVQAVDEEYDDEDHWFVHACEGHYEMYPGSDATKYRAQVVQ
jgi:hypothetical protein